MTDSSGTVVWAADYKPFGEAVVYVSTIQNNMRFPGQYYDEETGLHYNYYRYYDPSIGRYLTPDPIGLAGGVNLYAYVSNNPVNLYDPFGLWGEDVHSGIGNTKGYGTFTWAKKAGFTESGATIIAKANDGIDGGWNSWMPVLGDQSRHFNQFSRDGFKDSRRYWADVEFNKAIREWNNGNENLALAHIGRGLHSLQDIYAHRNWDTGITGRKRHPDWYDGWYDSRNKCAAQDTEQATMRYLKEFIRLTYSGYTH